MSTLNIFMIITLQFLSGRLFNSTSLSSLGVYLVPSFGVYSSVASCYLILFCFYVFDRSVTFPVLKNCPYVGGVLAGPAAHLLWSSELHVLGEPPTMWTVCVLLLWLSQLLWACWHGPHPVGCQDFLVWRFLATGGQGSVLV